MTILVVRPRDPRGDGAAAGHLMLTSPDDDALQAALVVGNPLASSWSRTEPLPVHRIVMNSGTLAAGPYESDPRNWMAAGRAALDRCCAALLAEHHDLTICLRPHCRHVLSDVPSCLRFLGDHDGEELSLALDPAALIEPAMRRDLDEHLCRIIEGLGPRCTLLLLQDLRRDEDVMTSFDLPLGEGSLPRDLVRRLVADCVPPETPVVLPVGRLDEQRAWLGR